MQRTRLPFKEINIKPAVALMASRCTADEVPLGAYRYVLNWEVSQKSKMCRSSGYKKMLDGFFANNADLHDQITGTLRQPLNFLWPFRMAIGLDKLFAGTQDKLLALNNSTGNWRVIADGYGGAESSACSDSAWWAAGYGDVTVFTNGQPGGCFWHSIDQPANDDGQSVQAIDDLALLKITQVGLVAHWNGLTFYCNVVEDGTRKSYRILWSDYQNPISLKPKASVSTAGYKDLAFGEVVLNALELGNSFIFYTNLGIWVCDNVGGEAVLSFSQRYVAKAPGDRCLKYPRTLVSTGSEHYYLGEDGIYMWSFYVPKPDRPDWMHGASNVIFDDLAAGRCLTPVAGYEARKKQIKFSWAAAGGDCNNRTLVFNMEFPFVSVEDFGATAYGQFGASKQYSLRQFILDQCICTAADLEAAGLGFVKEGGYCRAGLETSLCVAFGNPRTHPTPPVHPTCFWTNTGMDLDGASVEDFSQAQDARSLCALLAGKTVGDFCNGESDAAGCLILEAFIFADGGDHCLKESDPNAFYRERTVSGAGCGSYVKEGYKSLLRSGPIDLEQPGSDKYISKLTVEAYPAAQTMPSVLTCKAGSAGQALDPNEWAPGSHCVIMYEPQKPLPLVCQSSQDEAALKALGIRPDKDYAWALAMVGRFFYYEIGIENPDVTPPDTGGACCVSRVSFRASIRQLSQ